MIFFLFLSDWASEGRAWLQFLYFPHLKDLYPLMVSSLSFLFYRLNNPSSPSLSSYDMLQTLNHLSVPLLQFVHVSCIPHGGTSEW